MTNPGSRNDMTAEASHWVAASRSESMSEEERNAMAAWLEADPRHAEEFAKIQALVRSASALKSLAALEPRPSLPKPRLSRGQRAWTRLRTKPSRAVIAALAAASVAAAVIVGPELVAQPDIAVSTKVAEMRTLTLPDGTRVALGPRSRIKAYISDAERRVELAAGQAFFEVHHDARRPFIVQAGDTHVRVLGTKFDVNRSADHVRVAVLEGVVQVRESDLPFRRAPVRILRARQTIETKAEAALLETQPPPAVQPVEVSPGDWRVGRLAYVNARLSDVVADLNRYYAPGVVLADQHLADIRVATTLTPDEIETFFANLPIALAVAVSRRTDGKVVISARPDQS